MWTAEVSWSRCRGEGRGMVVWQYESQIALNHWFISIVFTYSKINARTKHKNNDIIPRIKCSIFLFNFHMKFEATFISPFIVINKHHCDYTSHDKIRTKTK